MSRPVVSMSVPVRALGAGGQAGTPPTPHSASLLCFDHQRKLFAKLPHQGVGSHRGRDLLGPRSCSNIGINRMGELDDDKPFVPSCKQRYGEDARVKAAEFVSLWQEHVKDPNWHPFKIVITGSNTEQFINDEDEKLVGLKKQLGEEVKAVTTVLLEINEYNASGSYVVSELWNNKENRKASIAEAIKDILKQLRAQKRRLTGTS